jgi:hypothetical protein
MKLEATPNMTNQERADEQRQQRNGQKETHQWLDRISSQCVDHLKIKVNTMKTIGPNIIQASSMSQ